VGIEFRVFSWSAEFLPYIAGFHRPTHIPTPEEIAREKIEQKIGDERNEREWKAACRSVDNEMRANGEI
jgi:hypothetical protein